MKKFMKNKRSPGITRGSLNKAPGVTPVIQGTIQRERIGDVLRRRDNLAGPASLTTLNSTSPGQALSQAERKFYDPRFGARFSNVRIHSDTQSAGLSRQLQARAFTHRNHIYLARRQDRNDRSLISHELTHVLQQQNKPKATETSSGLLTGDIVQRQAAAGRRPRVPLGGVHPRLIRTQRFVLFGRPVYLHREVAQKVAATNARFRQLVPNVADRNRITQAIVRIGGYVRRATATGGFSWHAVGLALDLNYNMGTLQNTHWVPNRRRTVVRRGRRRRVLTASARRFSRLIALVESVIQASSSTFVQAARAAGVSNRILLMLGASLFSRLFSRFNFLRASGNQHMLASWVFTLVFPMHLRNLLHMARQAQLGLPQRRRGRTIQVFSEQQALVYIRHPRRMFTRRLRLNVRRAEIVLRRAGQIANARLLATVDSQWRSVLRHWMVGRSIRRGRRQTTLTGYLDLPYPVVRSLQDNQWEWGGDWSSSKDFMHFQDRQALNRLRQQSRALRRRRP